MKKIGITINFDMDGCLAGLYDVPNWLEMLIAEDATPYKKAMPLLCLSALARKLNAMRNDGYNLGIISWLSKEATEEYNKAVTEAKLEWLKKHLPSVHWDEIHIVPYGTPKEKFCENPLDVLFDDEERNRNNWTGRAYDVKNILEILKEI